MFNIDESSHIPIYQQIVDKVKEYVLREILGPGDKLPSVRELSRELKINPNTIQKAYKELDDLGITVSSQGRGRFIAKTFEVEKDIVEIEEIRDSLKRNLISLSYMGYKNEEILKLIESILKDLRRD